MKRTDSRRSFLTKISSVLSLSAGASFGKQPSSSTFLDLLRLPDRITAYPRLEDPLSLTRSGAHWGNKSIEVETRLEAKELAFTIASPASPLSFLHVRWNAVPSNNLLILGDAWERSYGELGWRNIIPERVLPWYLATHDGSACHAYGVKTAARALCFWQLDEAGISLWMNLTNGGSGVELGDRHLAAATVVTRQGHADEDPASALEAFCRDMCSQPLLPLQPIYGSNDWYYAYGRNTAKQIVDDTEFIVSLSPSGSVRPFSVVDDGWAHRPEAFPDMARLSEDIRARKAHPGIWIRPLLAPTQTPSNLLLADARFGERRSRSKERAYDPTIPDSRELIRSRVSQVVGWGYELVKHDFSTYDLLGQWGFEMGPRPTLPGWSLHDRSQTNAEVILDLYHLIRSAAKPEVLILGCNTIGHLGQGLFNLQRTGDDTSGREWERTRRMGVNTLAFRLPQHGSFFIQDADCVGLSAAVTWEKNRQWLDLLARSGTALFISPGAGSRQPEQRQAIRDAFQLTAAGGSRARPVDWQHQSAPNEWKNRGASQVVRYNWSAPDGANPFSS